MIQREKEGRPILIPGDGTTLIHVGAAANTGKMIAMLTAQEVAIGKSYTVAHNEFMTHDDYVKLIGKVVGKEPEIVHIPTDIVLSIKNDELKNCCLSILSRYNLAFSVDQFNKDFPGFKWEVALEDAIKQFIDRLEEEGAFKETEREIIDDKIIYEWKKRMFEFNI